MEYRLACSHDGSALLESFLQVASPFHLAVFFDRLAGKYESLAGHRYGSHVLETILEACGRALEAGHNGLKEEAANEGLQPLDKQVIRAFEELKVSIIDAIHDAYGSHVWRALVSLFSRLPGTFASTLEALTTSLLEMDVGEGQGFRDLAVNQHAAPFLQALLMACKERKAGAQIVTKLLHNYDLESPAEQDEAKAKAVWKTLMQDEIGSRTAESVVALLNPQQLQCLYSNLIRGQSVAFLKHAKANFPLQHLVKAFKNTAQMESFVQEIEAVLPEVIALRRFGILIKFAEWASEHKEAFELIHSAILKAFHLDTSTEDRQLLFKACILLKVKEDLQESSANAQFNAQGCALMCLLARFPAKSSVGLIDGLLKCQEAEVLAMAKNPGASRVLEAFFAGGALSPKAIQRVGRHLKGHLATLACDKYGSHVVESVWKHSPLPTKNTMMEELQTAREKLESSQYGRMVVRTCRLNQFTRHREDWIKEEQSKTTKRSMFEEIING